MKKQKLILVFSLVLAIFLLTIGCSSPSGDNKAGLQIYHMTIDLGAVDNSSTDKQRLVYSVTLTNENNKAIYVQWIEPVLGTKISEKVITEDLKVIVEKEIPANQYLEIDGEFILDTKGLSKKEIISLEPFITGIKVTLGKTINLKLE